MSRTKIAQLLVVGMATRLAGAAVSDVPSAGTPPVQMLVPGFTVRELPVRLTSLNNIEYAPDGRLFAGGYDGRFHLLRDTNGDGLEDRVDTFSPDASANYPLGMAVKDGVPYAVLTDEVVRWLDTNGDGIPDRRETVIQGFDNPDLVKADYLLHRRVDSSMAIAFGPDGQMYVTLGNGAPFNGYWTDKNGSHYSPDQRRGCLLRISPSGHVEQVASGLRYIMSLQFNQHGDLFGTDQEGATWVPNGNPFDEFLHLQPGRHYGFPPRHPKWLPNVIDEPSVWDYAPQHQSTCGFRFNGPAPGRKRFGPEFWEHDAIVTGESRGKLWRTKLARTAAGYVAHTELIAVLGMLVVDCAISPTGDLVVCCHSGAPDWGNGPQGAGRIFKISHQDPRAPQPVLTYPLSATETVIAFDRPLVPADWRQLEIAPKIESGRYVAAADRWEKLRPGYAVVKMQQEQPRGSVAVNATRLRADGRSLLIESARRTEGFQYAISLAPKTTVEVAHDLSGLTAEWHGAGHREWRGWIPHPDFAAAREFTRASADHERLWKVIRTTGKLTLHSQLDLWQMLIPATQPLSQLDYTPEPETITVIFQSDNSVVLDAPGAQVERINRHESRLTVRGPRENAWLPVTLEVSTPARELSVSYHTTRDPRPRTLATRRFLVPFATPLTVDHRNREIPEIAGGDWQAGRELYRGKATCASCHSLRGDGFRVGPDLGNLVHRDYASVLKDIADPNATINPDAAGYVVTLKNGEEITGTRIGETGSELQIAQPGGAIARIPKSTIMKTTPLTASLMPTGLDKTLTATELRDLMTYLLRDSAPAK